MAESVILVMTSLSRRKPALGSWQDHHLPRAIGHHAATKPCAGGLDAYRLCRALKGQQRSSYEAIENEERLGPPHTERYGTLNSGAG